MSRDQSIDTSPIVDREQLLDFFRAGEKDRRHRGVGTEHEKFVFKVPGQRVASYEEPGGIGELLENLVRHHGWEATALDRGHLVALVRDGAAITLEPGGQFELSGAIFKTVFDTAAEIDTHFAEVKAAGGPGLRFAPWGLNPTYDLDQVPWMPKARYGIMRNYLPTRGDLAHWMMKGTCTIQANFDYVSEDDAADIIRTGVLASPLVGALFANSPVRLGKPTGMQSFRNHIWTRTDPDRSGVPAFMYRNDWGYSDYLEYLLDVPMFFIRREEGYIDLAGYSFRDFVEGKHPDYSPVLGDFELHASTLFPEVRLKQYIEVRSADGGPRDFIVALPALWKGLLYHEPSRRAVVDLFHPFDEAKHRELYLQAMHGGIHAESAYGPIAELSAELVAIATRGLEALASEFNHPSEATFLDPLRTILERGESLADRFARDFNEVEGDLEALLGRWAI
ncbi:glutamate--cysteine ligase [Lujinxingia litoralis]|uniref:Glutamate--cysteine ligase n=1 Tax=Lujinxingia litoralis TaxID=2211119 RepID=A0A328CCZ6_9DELT|nr:glutamate-cysteine ligase family protein [Lujinxingia litoralis]RAL24719.1 glutamate--cysteine ligase [Lujinxingia litoralis]